MKFEEELFPIKSDFRNGLSQTQTPGNPTERVSCGFPCRDLPGEHRPPAAEELRGVNSLCREGTDSVPQGRLGLRPWSGNTDSE